MDSVFWAAVIWPVAVGVALSFLQELQFQPRPQPVWRRRGRAFGAHVGAWLLLYGAELALFRRPWLAAVNVCVVYWVFVLVSNAKRQSLREPFIFQDFDYCRDMVKHPRLYLPFLGLTRALLGLSAIFGAVYLGLSFETSMLKAISLSQFGAGVAMLCAAGVTLLVWASGLARAVRFNPEVDLRQFGFVATLFAYGMAERSMTISAPAIHPGQPIASTSTRLADLVVVQSESFFDVRRHFPAVRRGVLSEYDDIVKSALHHGALRVPAWGANTVRTEFAFLAGMDATQLGVHRFNPYRKLIRSPFVTLATYLKSLGYKTICVHPYAASFYERDRVFPLMGFDEFLDIRAFDAEALGSPYIGDVPLADKVCACLDENAEQACFVFVITMENHGPLHLEALVPFADRRFYFGELPQGSADLSAYLRHMEHADRMIGILRKHLQSRARPAWLSWYGDHVPIMPEVYRTMGYPDGTTDYFVWRTGGVMGAPAPRELGVEHLAQLLLQDMQLGNR